MDCHCADLYRRFCLCRLSWQTRRTKVIPPHGPPSGGLFCCPLPEVLFRGKARIHAGDYPLKGQSVRHVRHEKMHCMAEGGKEGESARPENKSRRACSRPTSDMGRVADARPGKTSRPLPENCRMEARQPARPRRNSPAGGARGLDATPEERV